MVISYNKEIEDSKSLASLINEDGWLTPSTLLVCVTPLYSSIVTQVVNNALVEPLDTLYLPSLLPSLSQVWDNENKRFIGYDKYLQQLVASLDRDTPLLLLESNFSKQLSSLHSLLRVSSIPYRIATLYLSETLLVTPEYFIEKYNGIIKYEWSENT